MTKLDNRYLIGGVAVGAAILTAHGSFHAADLAGVPGPLPAIYPLILDGLAVVAWRATSSRERWRRNFARVIMLAAAAASAWAQGYALASAPNLKPGAEVLAWGMGIAPAVVVLVATILGASRELDTGGPASEASDDDEAGLLGSSYSVEPATDPWVEALPWSPPTPVAALAVTPDARPVTLAVTTDALTEAEALRLQGEALARMRQASVTPDGDAPADARPVKPDALPGVAAAERDAAAGDGPGVGGASGEGEAADAAAARDTVRLDLAAARDVFRRGYTAELGAASGRTGKTAAQWGRRRRDEVLAEQAAAPVETEDAHTP